MFVLTHRTVLLKSWSQWWLHTISCRVHWETQLARGSWWEPNQVCLQCDFSWDGPYGQTAYVRVQDLPKFWSSAAGPQRAGGILWTENYQNRDALYRPRNCAGRHVTLLEIGVLVIHSWTAEGREHFCGQWIIEIQTWFPFTGARNVTSPSPHSLSSSDMTSWNCQYLRSNRCAKWGDETEKDTLGSPKFSGHL